MRANGLAIGRASQEIDVVTRETPKDFVPLRLHYHSDDAWAVVERPSGAIALDPDEKLLIRLSQAAARETAETMTTALRDRESAFRALHEIHRPPARRP